MPMSVLFPCFSVTCLSPFQDFFCLWVPFLQLCLFLWVLGVVVFLPLSSSVYIFAAHTVHCKVTYTSVHIAAHTVHRKVTYTSVHIAAHTVHRKLIYISVMYRSILVSVYICSSRSKSNAEENLEGGETPHQDLLFGNGHNNINNNIEWQNCCNQLQRCILFLKTSRQLNNAVKTRT